MKVELEYLRLSVNALTEEVHVGIISKDGQSWKQSKNVTNDFMASVIKKWCGFSQEIKASDGKVYKISVKQIV